MEELYMEKSYDNMDTSNCVPNYEEQITKIITQLKELGATLIRVDVPEDLSKFKVDVPWDLMKKDPYTIYLIDNMNPYNMYEHLRSYKGMIDELIRKEIQQQTSKNLLKKLEI